jgi:hypothetical protein
MKMKKLDLQKEERREERRGEERRGVKSSPEQEGPEIHTRKKTRDEKVRKKENKQTTKKTKKRYENREDFKTLDEFFQPLFGKQERAAQWKTQTQTKLLLLPSRYLVTYLVRREESGVWTGV